MTGRSRAFAALPAAALLAVLAAGCGHDDGSGSATSPGATSPGVSTSELGHMQKLVDGADAAAAAAESDAAGDK